MAATLSIPSVEPDTYPFKGTFGELLRWHLNWGTRPGCDVFDKSTNEKWIRSKFARYIHEDGFDLESAKKNLRNWANKGKMPQDQDDIDAERVS